MEVLVCIDNNLKSDSRLKRHVTAIAKQAVCVSVLTNTCPEDGFGLDIKNVRQVCYQASQYQTGKWLQTTTMEETIQDLGVSKELQQVVPFLSDKREMSYYIDEVMDAYASYLSKNMKGGRFADITKRTAQQMEKQPAMSYVVIFLLNSIYMARKALQIPADVVLCNDIDTLLCGVAHKKKYNSRLVYDIHDITCDITAGEFPLLYSEMLMLYEKVLISAADAVIGVGNFILQWARLHYGVKAPCVPVYSCSESQLLTDVYPKKYSQGQPIRIYFHGCAYSVRKLENIVLAAKDMEDIELVFRTDWNEYMENVVKTALENGMQKRLHILPMVPTEDVIRKANADGDIGIYATDPESCVNWKASFTNKFMEYLGAGLPVITTKATDQMDVVAKYKCGFLLDGDSVEDIARVLQEVRNKRHKLEQMSENAWRVGREVFNWQKYEHVFMDVICGRDLKQYQLPDLTFRQKRKQQLWNWEDRILKCDYVCKE